MALHHAAQAESIDIRPHGLSIADARSIALFRTDRLELMRLVLPSGHVMPTHRVPGEITIQCLEGTVDVTVDGRPHVLPAGHLMHVEGGVDHGLRAVSDTSVLVTVLLCPDPRQ